MRTPNVGEIIMFRFSKGSIKINQLNRVKIRKIITNNIEVSFHLYGNLPTDIPQNQRAIPTIKIKSNTSPFMV